jgi:hypothetical protein
MPFQTSKKSDKIEFTLRGTMLFPFSQDRVRHSAARRSLFCGRTARRGLTRPTIVAASRQSAAFSIPLKISGFLPKAATFLLQRSHIFALSGTAQT